MNLPDPLSFLHAATTNPPTLEFILPGFIPGTVAGLVSPGGTGKSFFALELACAVAGGQAANLLSLPVTGEGPVLYLAAEDPPEILHKRLHHIARYMPESVIGAVNENLFVIPALASGVNVLEAEWAAEERKEDSGGSFYPPPRHFQSRFCRGFPFCGSSSFFLNGAGFWQGIKRRR